MNSQFPSLSSATTRDLSVVDPSSPSWGAIIAGAVAGLAVHLLLMMLFSAIGLGAADPATDDSPVATFAIGTAVVWSVSALIALWVGGWVAGRCAARVHSISGGMHGFLVWCSATLAAALIVAAGGGAAIGGTAQLLGKGASAVGKSASGVADLAKQALDRNGSLLTSMIDEAAESPGVRNAAGGAIAARRDIGLAMTRLLREGGDLRDPQARASVTQALTAAGVSEADATRMLDRWTASAQQLRTQLDEAKNAAAAKAREAADKASRALAKASLWSFIGFIIGAFSATWGGRKGAHWENEHTSFASNASVDPRPRPPITA